MTSGLFFLQIVPVQGACGLEGVEQFSQLFLAPCINFSLHAFRERQPTLRSESQLPACGGVLPSTLRENRSSALCLPTLAE